MKAYADDVTLTQSYEPQEATATTTQLNYNLSRIAAWGNKWRQVRFASQKTQAAASCLQVVYTLATEPQWRHTHSER